MTQPVSTPEAIARWQDLHSDRRNPPFLIGDDDRRLDVITALHALADFLESRPEIPVTRHRISVYTLATGTMAQQHAQVEYASLLAGVPSIVRDGCHQVTLEFGPVMYRFSALRDDDPPIDAHPRSRGQSPASLADKDQAPAPDPPRAPSGSMPRSPRRAARPAPGQARR